MPIFTKIISEAGRAKSLPASATVPAGLMNRHSARPVASAEELKLIGNTSDRG
jgi:hypothetical protein